MHDHYSARGYGIHRSAVPNWCIPLGYSIAAFALGLTLPRIEARFLPEWTSPMNASAATAIYSAVASGMIALTGIVFSLAFVMVQFSATAYSPRLVLWIARDPLLWHAVGIFSATFLYALGAIAWVQHDQVVTKMPFFSAWLVVALLVLSVAAFIALIEKLSLLQIHRMLAFTGAHGRRVIEGTYPRIDAPISMPGGETLRGLAWTQTLPH